MNDPVLKAIHLYNRYEDPFWFVERMINSDNPDFWSDVYIELLKLKENE